MAVDSDVSALLRGERRRQIARTVLDDHATIGEIARRIGVTDGAIRSVVERMVRDGLLTASQRPGRRGNPIAWTYQVKPAIRDAVGDCCRSDETPVLDLDREILVVPLAGLEAAADVLARSRPRAVGWAVRVRDPRLALMIGFRPDANAAERDATLLSMQSAGADCTRLFVGESMTPAALFAYAASLARGATATLPPAT
jgi:transposase-like protein